MRPVTPLFGLIKRYSAGLRNLHRTAPFLAVASLATVAAAQTNESRDEILLPDGRTLSRIVEGKGHRSIPFETIIVCSDRAAEDISNLRKVARFVAPGETYRILDGRDPSINPNIQRVTFAYFGRPIEPSAADECIDRFPRSRSFVLAEGEDIDRLSALLEEQLSVIRKEKLQFSPDEHGCGMSISRVEGDQRLSQSLHSG